MAKVTELPQVGLTLLSSSTFLVVDNRLVRQLPFQTLLPVLQQSNFGTTQQLGVTNNVTFAQVATNLTSATNAQVFRNLEVGGFVSLTPSEGQITLTNEYDFANTTLLIRGFLNRYLPTGTNHAVVLGELAGGDPGNPSNTPGQSKIVTFAAGGHSGRTFTDARGRYTGQLTFYATETWNDNTTATTNVGTGFYLGTHPQSIRLDASYDFQQKHILQDWEFEGNYPVATILVGSGIDGYKDIVRDNGITLTHEGSTKFRFLNTRLTIDGVVDEDTLGFDNATLRNSNRLVFVGNRRSASDERRNSLILNDSLGKLEFRGMNANTASISYSGAFGGEIKYLALEPFTAIAAGTRVVISTVNTGTTTSSNRLSLSNRENVYGSDRHRFTDSQGNLIGVISTGTDTALLSVRQLLTTATLALAEGSTATTFIDGFKSYMLSKIQTSQESWVRVYSDAASQTADLTRSVTDDPAFNINLITEVVTTAGGLTQVIAPGVFGFNNELPVNNRMYISITNNTSTVAPITATLTCLKLEL